MKVLLHRIVVPVTIHHLQEILIRHQEEVVPVQVLPIAGAQAVLDRPVVAEVHHPAVRIAVLVPVVAAEAVADTEDKTGKTGLSASYRFILARNKI
jgi:hypothetical protein